jgi:endonuclease/exonuclease/phosphatase family metal-dependent hydrolase
MRFRPPVLLQGASTLAVAILAGVAFSSAATASVQPVGGPNASAAANEPLRVVTANLAFRGPQAVRGDWDTIGPNADIVFVQEAKNVRLRDILDETWAVRQDTSSEDRQGSAVVIRKAAVKSMGDLLLVKGTGASNCDTAEEGGIMTRWIARVDVQLHNNRWIRAAALHMPPARCQNGPGSPYAVMADNVVAFAKRSEPLLVLGADWNTVVDTDPNEIGARTGLKPRGPDTGSRIDGFYVSPGIGTNNLHPLAPTGSDHRPVQMTIGVPAP